MLSEGTGQVPNAGITLVKRRLVVSFTIVQGGLGASGESDTITLEGHSVRCRIVQTGMEASSVAVIRIFGLSVDIMNRLSLVRRLPAAMSRNTVDVMVDDDAQGRIQLFCGGIVSASADFANAPDICFQVEASSACIAAARPVAATSFKGNVDIRDVYTEVARKAGMTFRHHGIAGTVNNPNLPGTAAQQIALLSHALRTVYHIGQSQLDVWPESDVQDEETPLLISSDTGIIGTPSYSSSGIAVSAIFNHRLRFYDTVEIRSHYLKGFMAGIVGSASEEASIWAPYNGIWRIRRVEHQLDAEIPGGAWRTALMATALSG